MIPIILMIIAAGGYFVIDNHLVNNSFYFSQQRPPDGLSYINISDQKEQVGVEPKRIKIPKIKVDALVEDVGENSTGDIDSPKDTQHVGWFKDGYKIREVGNAVIAGYRVLGSVPGVFHDLDKLTIGDQIGVTDVHGKLSQYKVIDKKTFRTDAFPTKDVFGESGKSMLNLIAINAVLPDGSSAFIERLVIYSQLDESFTGVI